MSTAELEWGIRESFVQYVEALPDGAITVGNTVQRCGGKFLLRGTVDGAEARFGGRIHFFGHSGVLDVVLDGVTLRSIGDRAAVWTSVDCHPVELAVVGAIEQHEGGLCADAIALTADGAALLGDVYQPGAALAPLTIRPVRDEEKGT